MCGCRENGTFRYRFFMPSFLRGGGAARPEIKNIGLLWGKVPMFCRESTEVCLKEVRCFAFPEPTLQKKFCVFLLHFLHQSLKTPLYIGDFRWRIGCRIQAGCRIYPALSVLFILFSHLFVPPYPAFSCDSVPDITWNCWILERFLCGSSAEHSRWILFYGCLLLYIN